MRRLLLLLGILTLAYIAKAQEDPMFEKGEKLVNIGVGINYYPLAAISADFCVADEILDDGSIGIGPYVGFGAGNGYSHFSVGARGTFHYPLVEKLDTYAGFGLGIRYTGSRLYTDYAHFIPGFFVGANYPISEKFKIYAEAGSGVAYITAGISFKL